MPYTSKTDEFSEKFQTAFDPPPSFSENYFAIFSENVQKRPFIKVQNLQFNFWIENDLPPLELFRNFIRFGGATLP